jgi:predicted O-methyltransferase YrrM
MPGERVNMSLKINLHFLLWNFGLAKAETQTTDAERDCIAKHAAGKRCLAEIGVWHGVTTCRIRKAMSPAATLFAVDPFSKGKLGFSVQRMIAQREVGRVPNGTVVFLRMKGDEAASGLAGKCKVDFVFIDGDHSYEGLQSDWNGWAKLISVGGVIALHDSRSTPTRAIDDGGSVIFTHEVILNDPQFEVLETVDSLTVLKRKQ